VEGILRGDEMARVQLRLPFGRTHQIKGSSISKRILTATAQPRDFSWLRSIRNELTELQYADAGGEGAREVRPHAAHDGRCND
jgi:hypothetical protein